MLEKNNRRIFLLVTTDCNLRCQYCFERGKRHLTCSVENLKKVLAKELIDKDINYLITFHGGEPFLEFRKIQEIVDWVRQTYTDMNVRFDVSTNGTILNEEIKNWLIRHQDHFTVSISIDGRRHIHNAMRCNSFDDIDINFFQMLKNVKVKMTVSPQFVSEMFDNFKYLTGMGFNVAMSMAQEVDWNETKYLAVYNKQLQFFIDYLLGHPNVGLPPFFRYDISKFSETRRCHRALRGCKVLFNTVGYGLVGIKYPCNGFLNNFNKSVDTKELDRISHILSSVPDEELLTDCKNCVIKFVCSTCYGLNYVYRGSIERINKQMCPYLIQTVYATASLWAKAIISGKVYCWMLDKSDTEIIQIIEGIQYLYKNR